MPHMQNPDDSERRVGDVPTLTDARLLVAVGPGLGAEHVIRVAQRRAPQHAEWTALYVETPSLQRLPEADRDLILGALRFAEELGARSVVIGGGDVASAVIEFARAQHITKLVVGRSRHVGWRKVIRRSTAERIVAGAPDLEVTVAGLASDSPPARTIVGARDALAFKARRKRRWRRYVIAALVPFVATVMGLPFRGAFELANIVMIFLLGVAGVAVYFGRGPSILASIISVAALNFFFVAPFHTFAVVDAQYVVTFGVMLIVGTLISELAARVRLQAQIAGYREERATALYDMSRELAATERIDRMLEIAEMHVSRVFESDVSILIPDDAGLLGPPFPKNDSSRSRTGDAAVARRAFADGKAVGLGTDVEVDSDAVFVPLVTPQKTVGVLVVRPANPRRVFVPEQRRLLDTFASQVAVALERAQLAGAARVAELRAESEGIRNALLAAISHELRTPLATIVGASSSLAEAPEGMSEPARRELARGVADEAKRMGELMEKVLDLARLQAGATRVQPGWHSVEEVLGAALSRLAGKLARHRVTTRLPARQRLARLDAVLIELVLMNLLENAAKYTAPGSHISVRADFSRGQLVVIVTDDGPGLVPGQEAQIFDKFHRGAPESSPGGVGLGLAICKAVVEAHGGTISAENIQAGGAMFRLAIPQDAEPPALEENAGEPEH